MALLLRPIGLAIGLVSLSLVAQPSPDGAPNAASVAPQLPGTIEKSATRPTPALPGTKTAADTFRELLQMTPAQREQALADRNEHQRQYLTARLGEYEALSGPEREFRLTQLELACHLDLLMKAAPELRATRLAAVPAALRPIVDERLRQWDLLPSKVQQEVLEHETTHNFFLRVRPVATNAQTVVPSPFNGPPRDVEEKSGNPMTALNQFLELSAREQRKTLEALTPTEREEMENALKLFRSLPAQQRKICVDSFERFSRMTPEQRDQFLKSAERWKALPARERETWRMLLSILPPASTASSLPPLPPGFNPLPGPSTGLTSSNIPHGGR